MHHSSTSTYVPNVIEIEEPFWTDGRTAYYGRADGHLRPTLLGRLYERSKNRPTLLNDEWAYFVLSDWYFCKHKNKIFHDLKTAVRNVSYRLPYFCLEMRLPNYAVYIMRKSRKTDRMTKTSDWLSDSNESACISIRFLMYWSMSASDC